MPYDYVEDYEQLMGKKPEPAPVDTIGTAAETVETKVVEAPETPEVEASGVQVETA